MICCEGNKYKYIYNKGQYLTSGPDDKYECFQRPFSNFQGGNRVFWKGTKFSTWINLTISGLQRSALHLHFGFLLLCRAHFLLPHVLQASRGGKNSGKQNKGESIQDREMWVSGCNVDVPIDYEFLSTYWILRKKKHMSSPANSRCCARGFPPSSGTEVSPNGTETALLPSTHFYVTISTFNGESYILYHSERKRERERERERDSQKKTQPTGNQLPQHSSTPSSSCRFGQRRIWATKKGAIMNLQRSSDVTG